jgi:hypothetical protein
MIRRSIVPRVTLRSTMASVSSRATRMDKRSFLACQSPMKLNSSQTTGFQTQSHNLTSTTPVLFRLHMYFLELWLPPFLPHILKIRDRFIERIMALPIELRHKIYEYLIWSWDPARQHHRNFPNGYQISLARRDSKPMPFQEDDGPSPSYRSSYRWWEEYCGSPERFYFCQMQGILDYFKRREYENLFEFVKALERFEGRAAGQEELHGFEFVDDIGMAREK